MTNAHVGRPSGGAGDGSEWERGAQVKQDKLFDIRGHVAFVTGAASGLGLAYAEVMADNGASVVLADIDAGALERAATRLASAGGTVEQAVVDIRRSDALRAAIDRSV